MFTFMVKVPFVALTFYFVVIAEVRFELISECSLNRNCILLSNDPVIKSVFLEGRVRPTIQMALMI